MKFQFNWGTGILITIIIFFGLMISVIVFSFNQPVNLVSPDYYPKGIDFDKQIEKNKNTSSLAEKVSCRKNNDSLVITFPKEFKTKSVKGNILFYYITDYKKDIKKDIALNDSGIQVFKIHEFRNGRYILKLDWSDGLKSYYQEFDVNL